MPFSPPLSWGAFTISQIKKHVNESIDKRTDTAYSGDTVNLSRLFKGVGIMDFQIGQTFIKSMKGGRLVIVVPIGGHVIATRIEIFEIAPHNSIQAIVEIYNKEDIVVVDKVQRWMKEDA